MIPPSVRRERARVLILLTTWLCGFTLTEYTWAGAAGFVLLGHAVWWALGRGKFHD